MANIMNKIEAINTPPQEVEGDLHQAILKILCGSGGRIFPNEPVLKIPEHNIIVWCFPNYQK
jgi:hypothetical protein